MEVTRERSLFDSEESTVSRNGVNRKGPERYYEVVLT